MPKRIALLLCISFLQTARSQELLQYSFTHYNTSSGLLSNQVNTVAQDDEGYIWTGTTDGLQRFDGMRYKSFRHQERQEFSLPSNPVWQLLMDKKQRLWLMLADGRVGIFDRKKFIFREVPAHFKKAVSPNTFLKRLIQDEYGNLFYLMGGSEVISWNENANEFSYSHNFFDPKPEWGIADFIQEPGTQKYWFSIEGGGIAIFNRETRQFSYTVNQDTRYHLFFDRQHRLWSITQGSFPYIHCQDLKTGKTIIEKAEFASHLKSYHEIKGFFQQRDGTIWVSGLLVFAKFQESENQFQFVYNGYQKERSIAYEMIHCLYEDRENNLWVGTDNNGLYRFNPATEFFTNINHDNRSTGNKGEGSVMSFIQTKWGTILAGTQEDGLYQYDQHFNTVPLNIKGLNSKEGPVIWSMFASRDSNTIWMSSQPGIYAIDQAKHSCNYYNPPALENGTIRQIAEDPIGNLWLGMQGSGVFKWTAAKGKTKFNDGISAFTLIPQVTVNKIMVDSKGLVWFTTPENGIYVVDPKTDKIIMRFSAEGEDAYKLPESGASTVLEFDDSTIIITTATHVLRYNPVQKKTVLIGTSEIISGFITAVERDKQGYLWLTSTSGLYRIIFKKKKIFQTYDRADGIENEHFTQSASRLLPDGRMLFGTTNHFISFEPERIRKNSTSPNIRITDFKVMNKSLPVDSLIQLKEIELGYQDNSLMIEFSSVTFKSDFLLMYKMDGLDKDWRVSYKNWEAVYSYLPPGNYTFKLKAIDEDGNESGIASQLHIKIDAPFWKTIWFYSLLALAAGGLLYWLDMERMNRKEALQRVRSEIADNLHHEVNVALSNINILSEMANLKVNKEPQKSREYIEQIHNRSQNMMIAMDDMLWCIKPENDNMAKVVDRFTEHIDSLRNRYGIRINLLVDKKVEALKLDMKLRKNAFWLFKGGSSNVIRSGATDVNIHIGVQKQNLVYTLEFSNANLNSQQLNNLLQRQELADKLKEVNGVIQARLQGSRSTIELTIPV